MQQKTHRSLGIIGGGLSGITTGYFLNQFQIPNLEFQVFEKAHHISGGRACSRTLDTGNQQIVYDYGANYLSFQNQEQKSLIFENIIYVNQELKDSIQLINKPIYILNSEGNKIQKSDEQGEKYTFPKGLNYLTTIMADKIKDTIHVNHGVNRVEKVDNKWRVYFDKYQPQEFDYLLFAQTPTSLIKIFQNSLEIQPNNQIIKQLLTNLQVVKYRKILSIFMAYQVENEDIDPSQIYEFFALLNLDRKHNISWLSFENDKPGHIQKGYLGVTVQMSNEWSQLHWQKDDKQIEYLVKNELQNVFKDNNKKFTNNLQQDILSSDNLECYYSYVKKWNYALHDNQPENINAFKENQKQNQLYFCGDFLFPKARVANAIESGMQVSQTIFTDLNEKIYKTTKL